MRVLVTGGSGFVGSHVVDTLVEYGVTVRVFDKVDPSRDDVEFYQGSLLSEEDLQMALSGVDAVIHLGAIVDLEENIERPAYAQKVNVQGTSNLLEAMRHRGVDRLVYASTSWVYSDTDGDVLDESSSLQAPSHFYAVTKIAAEYYCRSYANHYDFETTVVRYGIPFGPRALSGTVVPVFVEKAINGEPLTVFGDGSQYRKFIYVGDIAEGTVLALQPDAVGNIYNLTGNEKITINEVAETIRDVVADVPIEHVEGRAEDYGGKDISSEKARRDLDWEPTTSFKEGVEQYVEWYLDRKEETERRWDNVDDTLQ